MQTFPSKTFILGEYSVLRGGSALMLGHSPFFECDLNSEQSFHPESPAGKFCSTSNIRAPQFKDPHNGAGGFGCSGAEFLSCWCQKNSLTDRESFAWNAWSASRDFPGSGADILTQAYGMNLKKHFFLEIQMEDKKIQEISPPLINLQITLLRTGKKLPTHEHLKNLPAIPANLEKITQMGIQALKRGDKKSFLACIHDYAQALANIGLVCSHTKEILQSLPTSLAAKGCGAMGADVVLVAHEKDLKFPENLQKVVQISL